MMVRGCRLASPHLTLRSGRLRKAAARDAWYQRPDGTETYLRASVTCSAGEMQINSTRVYVKGDKGQTSGQFERFAERLGLKLGEHYLAWTPEHGLNRSREEVKTGCGHDLSLKGA